MGQWGKNQIFNNFLTRTKSSKTEQKVRTFLWGEIGDTKMIEKLNFTPLFCPNSMFQ